MSCGTRTGSENGTEKHEQRQINTGTETKKRINYEKIEHDNYVRMELRCGMKDRGNVSQGKGGGWKARVKERRASEKGCVRGKAERTTEM